VEGKSGDPLCQRGYRAAQIEIKDKYNGFAVRRLIGEWISSWELPTGIRFYDN